MHTHVDDSQITDAKSPEPCVESEAAVKTIQPTSPEVLEEQQLSSLRGPSPHQASPCPEAEETPQQLSVPMLPEAMGEDQKETGLEQSESPVAHASPEQQSGSTSVIRQLTATGTIITTVSGSIPDPDSPQDTVLISQQQLTCPDGYNSGDYYIPSDTNALQLSYDGNYTQFLESYPTSTSTQYESFPRDDVQANGIPVEYIPQPHHTVTLHNDANLSATYSYADPSYQLSTTSTQNHDLYTPNSNVVMLEDNVQSHFPYGQCVICGQNVHPQQQNFTDTRGHTICNNCAMRANPVAPRVQRPNGTNRNAKKVKATAQTRRTGVTCANCQTNKTTLWRRNNGGEPVCNSCGLYYKLHNMNRPKSMVKDTIQTRKRKPKPNATMVSHSMSHQPHVSVRMPSLHPSTLHHHPHPLSSASSSQASDINLMASYPTDQPYTFPAYINPPMRVNTLAPSLQSANVISVVPHQLQNANVNQNGSGHEEQATVITSTSALNTHYPSPNPDSYSASDEMRDL